MRAESSGPLKANTMEPRPQQSTLTQKQEFVCQSLKWQLPVWNPQVRVYTIKQPAKLSEQVHVKPTVGATKPKLNQAACTIRLAQFSSTALMCRKQTANLAHGVPI